MEMSDFDAITALGLSLALGLLIGIERGWTLRNERAGSRFAGIRTFGLLGLAGGIAGYIRTAYAGLGPVQGISIPASAADIRLARLPASKALMPSLAISGR